MPKKFEQCVLNGGKVRTVSLPGGKYMRICIPKGGGSSVRGEIKQKQVAEGFITEADGRFQAVLLREGVSKNGNEWTREMVESLVPLADGVPVHLYDMSADGSNRLLSHWEALRQKLPPRIQSLLPSRLPNATVGTIREPSVRVVNGKAQLEGFIESTKPKVIRGLLRTAKRLGRALGLSIHIDEGNLDSIELETGGLKPIKAKSITGWDIVSFPSAGGQFLPVLEAWTKEDREMKNLVRRLLALLTDDQREAVTEAVEKMPSHKITKASTLVEDYSEFCNAVLECLDIEVDDGQRALILESLVRGTPEIDPEPKPKPKAKAKKSVTEEEGGDEGGDPKSGSNFVSREEFDAARRQTQKLLEAQTRRQIKDVVEDAELPEKLATFATKHWNDILEAHGDVDLEDVETFVADLKSGLGRTTNTNGSTLESDESGERFHIHGEWNSGDKFVAAFEAMLEDKEFGVLEGKGNEKIKVPALHGIKQSYQILTGDLHMEGLNYFTRPLAERRRLGLFESIDRSGNPFVQLYRTMNPGVLEVDLKTTDYPLLLSNLMHKMMVKEYMSLPQTWQLVGRSIRASDFKDMIYHKFGEFPNFATVAEAAAYLEVTAYPSEEDVTWKIEKRGGWAKVTYEMIRNDDLDQIKRIPGKMARAGMRTLNAHVFSLLVTPAVYEPDSKLVFHADHNNIVTTAHSYDNIKSLRLKMHLQTDIDSIEAGRIRPVNVLCGPEIYDDMYNILFTDGKPNLNETGEIGTATSGDRALVHDSVKQPNILRSKYGLGLHECHDMDANDYYLVANPNVVDMIVVAFLDNKKVPEMFIQDMQNVGVMFTNDQIMWKLRHIYKGVVVDYKPFAGGIVA